MTGRDAAPSSFLSGEQAIDALAAAVAKRLARSEPSAPVAVGDAAALGARIGASAEWVKAHYRELGGWRLGRGPKAPYRFDLAEAERTVREWSQEPQLDDQPPPKPKPRQKQASRVELLPIRGTDPT